MFRKGGPLDKALRRVDKKVIQPTFGKHGPLDEALKQFDKEVIQPTFGKHGPLDEALRRVDKEVIQPILSNKEGGDGSTEAQGNQINDNDVILPPPAMHVDAADLPHGEVGGAEIAALAHHIAPGPQADAREEAVGANGDNGGFGEADVDTDWQLVDPDMTLLGQDPNS